jgi:hypothetical protein
MGSHTELDVPALNSRNLNKSTQEMSPFKTFKNYVGVRHYVPLRDARHAELAQVGRLDGPSSPKVAL